MKGAIFLDIDTQCSFMHKGGKFYVPDAESIIPNLKRITQLAKEKNISVIASADMHPELGANEQEKIPETILSGAVLVPNKRLESSIVWKLKEENRIIIEKQEHNIFSNPNLKLVLNGAKKAYVYGVATDYCVKAAVIGLRETGIETYVISDAIKPIFKKNEKKDLDLFSKKGAKFLTTSQLLRKKRL